MKNPPTFFEGPEKKLELAVADDHPSLRALGRDFWARMVRAARAEILSERSNEHFDAYLLSESSLFVYDHFITMITCGRTTLVDAIEEIVKTVDRDRIEYVIYERKNEHFPSAQVTGFYEDARRLGEIVPGRALRFGAEHEHAVRVFHSTRPYQSEPGDRTLEVLMHDIDETVATRFTGPGRAEIQDAPAELQLPNVLEGFEIDQFAFEPDGYSLNAQRGEAYVTLHITPERLGSYVSFETNASYAEDPGAVVREVLERFRPESFDVVLFDHDPRVVVIDAPGYVLRRHVREPVSGYHVTFQHFYRPSLEPSRALEVPLEP